MRINPLEYITGHLPKAVNIADNNFRGPNGFLPVQYWQEDKIGSLFAAAGITNGDRVVVYSDGRDVLGATMVAYLLERSGFRDVAVLDGGFKGYKGSEQKVTKEFPKYQPGSFTVRDNPSIRVTLAEVEKLIGKPDVVFIDPRPEELFQGKQDIWLRNGHIPGAKNIPWPTFTEANNPDESLKNPHKLLLSVAVRDGKRLYSTLSSNICSVIPRCEFMRVLGQSTAPRSCPSLLGQKKQSKVKFVSG